MSRPQPSLARIPDYNGPHYSAAVSKLNDLFDQLLSGLKEADELVSFLESVGAEIGVKTYVETDYRTVDEHECRAVLFVQLDCGYLLAVTIPGSERSAAIYSLTANAGAQELFARLLVEVVRAKLALS